MKQKFLFRLINKNKNEVIIDFLITVIAYLIIYKYISISYPSELSFSSYFIDTI